jgi:predicted nucleic acid-binding protein
MASSSVAVLDTDVISLFLSNGKSAQDDEARKVRRERTHWTIEQLREKRADFRIPTPVIAELLAGGLPHDLIASVMQELTRCRVIGFDLEAAKEAGRIIGVRLPSRPKGEKDLRAKMKFDALIAGTAHAMSAKWLVTCNAKDMRACLDALKSPVEIVVASEPPAKGQLNLVHLDPKLRGG